MYVNYPHKLSRVFSVSFSSFMHSLRGNTLQQSKSLEENNSILHMQVSQKGFPKKKEKKEERERKKEEKGGGACCVSYHVTIE